MRSYKKCSKCNRMIQDPEECPDGLCPECYHEYLLDKIEHLGEHEPKSDFSFKDSFQNLLETIKKFFHKEK